MAGDQTEWDRLIAGGERDFAGLNRAMAETLRRRGIRNPELTLALTDRSREVDAQFLKDHIRVAHIVDQLIAGDSPPSNFDELAARVLAKLGLDSEAARRNAAMIDLSFHLKRTAN